MSITNFCGRLFAVVALLLCGVGAASAQATRTWVSGVGDDANPCSRTAPCKTFAGAISKTAAGGVINVLDPGGFGGVTITKAITIEAVGDVAGVLVAGTNGVVVNAGANDVVVLRGLSLHGVGTGLNGINFLAGKSLIVDQCVIESFSGDGIAFKPSTTASLVVRNTLIRSVASNGTGGGINVAPTGAGSANIAVEALNVSDSTNGLRTSGMVRGTVSRSTFLNNAQGIAVLGPGNGDVSLDEVEVTGSSVFGVLSQTATSTVRLSNSTITANEFGIRGQVSGRILSFGNNRISGNVFDGSPTGTIATQ